MKKCFLVVSLVLVFSALTFGQSEKVQVFGGYQYTNADTTDSVAGRLSSHGWDADVAFKLMPHLSAVADFSGAYKSQSFTDSDVSVDGKLKVHNFLFGPRVSTTFGKFTPFGEALFGVAHTSLSATSSDIDGSASSNGFGMALGGGLDLNAGKHFAFRLGKFDYLYNKVSFDSSSLDLSVDKGLNHFRYSTGIVFKF